MTAWREHENYMILHWAVTKKYDIALGSDNELIIMIYYYLCVTTTKEKIVNPSIQVSLHFMHYSMNSKSEIVKKKKIT